MPALIIFFTMFFSSFFGLFFNAFEPQDFENIDTIYYRIKPVPAADRTNLEISVRFKSAAGKPVTIKLPVDYYGTPDIYRYVTSFEGESGTIVKPGKDDRERIVEPSQNGEVSLKYIISYDPKTLPGTYSPNIAADHFHTAGCQWALQIGELNETRRYSVEISGVPRNWQMYSSLGANPLKFETIRSLEDLIPTAIGGGEKQNFRRFIYKGKPVTVFIEGSFNIPNREIFAAVQKIVRFQRSWFNDYSQPFYNVVILPKEDNIAGTNIKNQFICFIKKDITREQLYVLLAHEMFHTWLSGQIIRPAKGVSDLRYAWFYEGFTDYFARKILLDVGLLSKEKFTRLINRDIINIADNPNRTATFDQLIEASKNGKYNQAFNKLSYYRGALIALDWEAKIRRAAPGKTLGDFIQDAYRSSVKNDRLSERQFFELAKSYGLDAEGDFESYIVRGEPIKIDPTALGNSFKLKESVIPSFDPGFDIGQSFRERKAIGVKENGAAFQVGLRNGMELADGTNLNRFGNAWNPDKPMTLVIKDGANKRRIVFRPHGASLRLSLFEPTFKIKRQTK